MFNTCIKILLNEEKYTDATQINLGQSRIGGSIIDYPKSETIADNLYLLAQLNLSDIKSSEFKDLLPASGFLYFLVEDDYLEGCVKYFDVPVEQLVRLHHQNEAYEIGRKITGFADQFLPDEDEDAYEESPSGKFDPFATGDDIRLFGTITCYNNESEDDVVTDMDMNYVLLQIGANYFLDSYGQTSCQTIRIPKNDLKKLKFETCEFFMESD